MSNFILQSTLFFYFYLFRKFFSVFTTNRNGKCNTVDV